MTPFLTDLIVGLAAVRIFAFRPVTGNIETVCHSNPNGEYTNHISIPATDSRRQCFTADLRAQPSATLPNGTGNPLTTKNASRNSPMK